MRSCASTAPPARSTRAAATIKAARAASIPNVDGYVFPCVTCATAPGAQVRAAVDALDASGATIGMLWLDIERYEWSTNFTASAPLSRRWSTSATRSA